MLDFNIPFGRPLPYYENLVTVEINEFLVNTFLSVFQL